MRQDTKVVRRLWNCLRRMASCCTALWCPMLELQPVEGQNKTKTTTANGSKNRKWKITGRQVRDRRCPYKTSSSLEKINSIEACVNIVLRNLNSPGYNSSSESRTNSGAGTTKMKIDIPNFKRKVGKNRFYL